MTREDGSRAPAKQAGLRAWATHKNNTGPRIRGMAAGPENGPRCGSRQVGVAAAAWLPLVLQYGRAGGRVNAGGPLRRRTHQAKEQDMTDNVPVSRADSPRDAGPHEGQVR